MVPGNGIGLNTSRCRSGPAKRGIKPVPLFIDDNGEPARIVARPVAPILSPSATHVYQKFFLTCSENLCQTPGMVPGCTSAAPLFEFLTRQKIADLDNANVVYSEISCCLANVSLTPLPNSYTTSRIVNSVTGCVGHPNPL